jgi:hypothetical protein
MDDSEGAHLEMIQMLSDRIDGYDADMDRLSKK